MDKLILVVVLILVGCTTTQRDNAAFVVKQSVTSVAYQTMTRTHLQGELDRRQAQTQPTYRYRAGEMVYGSDGSMTFPSSPQNRIPDSQYRFDRNGQYGRIY